MREYLNDQMQTKKKEETNFEVGNIFMNRQDTNSCNCDGRGKCFMCKKEYPNKFLNSKDFYNKLIPK